MANKKLVEKSADVEISNIGGIEHSTATFDAGVTILTGKNATNRTSFLQALMAVCGSNRPTLKANTDEGSVELTIGGESFTRKLKRKNGDIHFDGTPYLDDPTVADLFAFLLEDNEARQAVTRGEDLRELIMRPVDTNQIKREIENLASERDDIDSTLDHLDSLESELPDLKAEQQRLTEEISEKKTELETKRKELDRLDSNVEETQAEKKRYQSKVDELSDKRQELKRCERKIQSERESLESLRTERNELKEKASGLEDVPEGRITQIEQKIQRLHDRLQQIDSTVGDIQPVIQFNEEFIKEGQSTFVENLAEDTGRQESDLTDQLVSDSEDIMCWTCGGSVETDQIEATLQQLRTFRNDKMDQRRDIEDQMEDLKEEKKSLKKQRQNSKQITESLADVKSEINERELRLQTLTEEKEHASGMIEELEEEVNELSGVEQSDVLEVQKEITQLEVELERLEEKLEDAETEIAELESQLANRQDLELQREEITSELTGLRTRVEDLQEEAIDAFNEHMSAVLERLDYGNIERIWIERIEDEIREGRRKVTTDKFVLHIVRSTESGVAYEDTIDHLSESERKVTGLVFALAGYLVHEVYEQVPFMLLDSIESIDSSRISHLIDYLSEYAEYLVVALLEEDAAALDESYPRIESI